MPFFIDESFMLHNATGKYLYEKYAKSMPIFDYHSHLSGSDLLNNKKFSNLTELWLKQDHYKWRLLRAAGVDEKYITGDGSDYDKFLSWSGIVSKCIGNPIYHWTHMELKNNFGIEEALSEKTAPIIWEKCNACLEGDDFTPISLLERAGVAGVCTTDDPTDDLMCHKEISSLNCFSVIPTFRPDKALDLENKDFNRWLKKLEKASGIVIQDIQSLRKALRERCKYFKDAGCLSADHSMENPDFSLVDFGLAESAFSKARNDLSLTQEEKKAYQAEMMIFLGSLYSELDMAMQLHLGAVRNLNEGAFMRQGWASGYDAMGESVSVRQIAALFNRLAEKGKRPKTILFSSNPADSEKLNTLTNCFNDGSLQWKAQVGAAWWFNDHRDGIESQIKEFARQGVLWTYLGMLTDSRSILSMSRHEYFRRILSNLLGEWVEKKEIPWDEGWLGSMVQDICYNNAVKFFKFESKGRGRV